MSRTRALLLLLLLAGPAFAQDAPRDHRLDKAKTLDGYFPFTPPHDLTEWGARRDVVQRQLRVALGLWPMPTKTPLEPVVHGKIERDGYTIEKVYFASLPGHYVSGNLYRPTGRSGKLPAVLSPHGHWNNGRFYENGAKSIEKEIASGAEKTVESAKYPLPGSSCADAPAARLGCVVFHYDMVGYADSQSIKHRTGFKDVEAGDAGLTRKLHGPADLEQHSFARLSPESPRRRPEPDRRHRRVGRRHADVHALRRR